MNKAMNEILKENENKYFKTLDENFEQALNLVSREFSDEKLLGLLKNGNVPQKQYAVLNLKTVTSKDVAKILIDNLTGQDGKVREVVSLRVNEFMLQPETLEYFKSEDFYDVFLEAIVDINGNICRNIIGAIANLKDDATFTEYFTDKLIEKIWQLLEIIKDFDLQDGKYKVNKEVFKLYWCMEALCEFAEKVALEKLKPILLRTKDIRDYTIREKTAKILAKNFADPELDSAKLELSKDENYYVRRYFA